MTLARIYASGNVRRWHCNPTMVQHSQTIADHQGRCVQLLLMLHPCPSVALIQAVAYHDVGERWCGDVPNPAKVRSPALKEALDAEETQWRADIGLPAPDMTPGDREWLKLIDRLEAWAFVALHHPSELARDGWERARNQILHRAKELGVRGLVGQFMQDMSVRDW